MCHLLRISRMSFNDFNQRVISIEKMTNRPWTTYWINRFQADPKYGKIRFKRLESGYPLFEIENSLIDVVEMDVFVKIEDDRIPLFVGSQFGLNPKMNQIPNFFNGRKVIAILSKSLLSGAVSGLSLHEIGENDKVFKPNILVKF